MYSDTRNDLSPEEDWIVNRVKEIIYNPSSEYEPLSSGERQGMRAYLQRAETRLSTYQRIAGVFLNGAGLLVLLPGLARESVYSTIAFSVSNFILNANNWFTLLLIIPWLVSTTLPLYAFTLLLRDLVQFYFSPQFLKSDPLRINRFALSGVTLAYDEAPEAKARVIAQKIQETCYADFMMGTSRSAIETAMGESRDGRAAYPLRLAVKNALNDPNDRNNLNLSAADYIGVALSLAGSLDQSLVGEVARMEASVARHVLLLRKLVLRYTKALILFVWTTLVSISISSFLNLPKESMSIDLKVIISFFLYSVWSFLAIFFVRRPMEWIDYLMSDIEYSKPFKSKAKFNEKENKTEKDSQE